MPDFDPTDERPTRPVDENLPAVPDDFELTQVDDYGRGWFKLTHTPCGESQEFAAATLDRLDWWTGTHHCGGAYWQDGPKPPVVAVQAVECLVCRRIVPVGDIEAHVAAGHGGPEPVVTDVGPDSNLNHPRPRRQPDVRLTADVLGALGDVHDHYGVPAATFDVLMSFVEAELERLDVGSITAAHRERIATVVDKLTVAVLDSAKREVR